MKKILALCLSLCLSIGMNSVSAFAANTELISVPIEKTVLNEQIIPLSIDELLDIPLTWFTDSYSVKVTPTKGRNMKIIIKTTDKVKIEVIKNGGWWPSKTVTIDAGTQTIDLINDCNGETYTIKFTSNTGITIAAKVIQTEYI